MSQTVMEDGALRIVLESTPSVVVVSLVGQLDLASARLVRAVASEDLGRATPIMIDLQHLTFSDSTGMLALLDLQAEHQAHDREVRIVNACPLIRRLSALMGQEKALAD